MPLVESFFQLFPLIPPFLSPRSATNSHQWYVLASIMIRPAIADMLVAINEQAAPDLLFLFVEAGVPLDQQFDLVDAGYDNVRKFSGYDDDRVKVRAAFAADLTLDVSAPPPAGKLARLALAALVIAWETSRERMTKETQLRTEAKVNGVTKQVDILERTSMKKAVEQLHGEIPQHEAPSADYLSHKVEEMEMNDPTASPLDEVSSMTDLDLSASVPGWDAAGRSQLFRKRAKGSLPLNPEAFRTKMRVEKNLWLYLALKFTNRAWLVGLVPRDFEIYVDYFLGKKVMLLEVCQADGTKLALHPPWNIILSYELECRKSALVRVAEQGLTFKAALLEVVKDPELKELAFTSPVAHLGRTSTRPPKGSGKGNPQLNDNPNWPGKKRDAPYAQGRGKGKGKNKGKGKDGGGKGKGKKQAFATPDGRHICFSYNSVAGCTDPNCSRAHVCRTWGCYGTHPATECPTAPVAVAGA